MEVLAEAAGQVAARRSKGEYVGAGQKVVEWLFFNWINRQSAGAAIGFGNQLVADSPTDKTRPAFPLRNVAVPRTERTFDPSIRLLVPVSRRFHELILTLFTRLYIH